MACREAERVVCDWAESKLGACVMFTKAVQLDNLSDNNSTVEIMLALTLK